MRGPATSESELNLAGQDKSFEVVPSLLGRVLRGSETSESERVSNQVVGLVSQPELVDGLRHPFLTFQTPCKGVNIRVS